MAAVARSRGALILLEGVDRSGKTTQWELLVKYLKAQQVPVCGLRFPDRTTKTGQLIDAYLQSDASLDDRAIHLLFSANRWESAAAMKRMLDEGTTVVLDRYAYSGVAFTAAKATVPYQWCKECDTGLPRPDLVVYLNLAVSEAKNRGRYGEERYEREEFQRCVRAVYHLLEEEAPSGLWWNVNASQPIEVLHCAIRARVLETIKQCNNLPLVGLW